MPVNTDLNIHNIVMCANLLVKHQDKYLLLKRSAQKKIAPNILHIPGGKIDPTEDPLEAAQRELLEETGLEVHNIRLEGVVTEVHELNRQRYQNDWLIFYFSGDYKSGDLLSTEEGELLWLTKDQINKQMMFPSVSEIIETILDPQAGTLFARFAYDENEKIISKKISVCKK